MAVALDGNNVGGINDGTFAKRQPGYAGANGRYARFKTLSDGVNAMAVLLTSYIKGGYDTPYKIAHRWAPKSDGNDSDTYAQRIARGLHIGVNDHIPVANVKALVIVQAAIENAAFPARWGVELARLSKVKGPQNA